MIRLALGWGICKHHYHTSPFSYFFRYPRMWGLTTPTPPPAPTTPPHPPASVFTERYHYKNNHEAHERPLPVQDRPAPHTNICQIERVPSSGTTSYVPLLDLCQMHPNCTLFFLLCMCTWWVEHPDSLGHTYPTSSSSSTAILLLKLWFFNAYTHRSTNIKIDNSYRIFRAIVSFGCISSTQNILFFG